MKVWRAQRAQVGAVGFGPGGEPQGDLEVLKLFADGVVTCPFGPVLLHVGVDQV
ncbi:MAG TPA: hypothetical protein VER33_23770 [Polyangiaceae bacterium]|nr:hypothetical protein [Polyangiaceae bacterium]